MSHASQIENKRRLKLLYEETKHNYGCGAWVSDRKGYYRYTCHDKALKRIARRKARRADGLLQRSAYKRVYDYWWSVL